MQPEAWTEEEFAAAIGAYLEMLDAHQVGRPFNKAETRRRLHDGPLSSRTEASIEYRMQNISAVLALQGRPYLPGYLPAQNVGVRGTRIISSLIESAFEPEPTEDPTKKVELESLGRRVFVTGMWGFNSAREGYVGFTNERTRDRLVSEHQPGDLMLIVGQRGAFSEERDVGRLLGIVELTANPILEIERMAPEAYKEKVARFGAERWKFALPIKRSWVMGREFRANAILPVSYAHKYARSVGTSYRELTPEETARVLGLPVRAVAVWGEPDWKPDEQNADGELRVSDAVFRGPRPWFGTSETSRRDGDTKLYLMKLTGCVDALFPKLRPATMQRAIIKVGRSNDPNRRERELNFGFPPSAEAKWKLEQVQTFRTADEAHNAEQKLLNDLEGRACSLGAEFGIIPTKELSTLLAKYAGSSAFHIKL
jgi:hypothetical protein